MYNFLFEQKNKVDEGGDKGKNEQLGSGRTIPIKQVSHMCVCMSMYLAGEIITCRI